MLGLLRGAVRPPSTRPVTLVCQIPARQLATFRPFQPQHITLARATRSSQRFSISPGLRPLSLGSIFSRGPPTPSPTPVVVAHITRLEAEANVNPHDVQKQLALFRALVDTKLKSSHDLIINRWERMCEFVRQMTFYMSG